MVSTLHVTRYIFIFVILCCTAQSRRSYFISIGFFEDSLFIEQMRQIPSGTLVSVQPRDQLFFSRPGLTFSSCCSHSVSAAGIFALLVEETYIHRLWLVPTFSQRLWIFLCFVVEVLVQYCTLIFSRRHKKRVVSYLCRCHRCLGCIQSNEGYLHSPDISPKHQVGFRVIQHIIQSKVADEENNVSEQFWDYFQTSRKYA